MLPVLPQLIVPLKAALNTRDRGVIAVALRLLQKLVLATPGAGPALVPYYRQLLPVLNLYRAWCAVGFCCARARRWRRHACAHMHSHNQPPPSQRQQPR